MILVYVVCDDLGRPPRIPIWRKPLPIDWEQVDDTKIECQQAAAEHDDPYIVFQQVFRSMEEGVQHALQQQSSGLTAPRQGRCTTVEPRVHKGSPAPPKRSRPKELEVTFMENSSSMRNGCDNSGDCKAWPTS